jgi:spermidine synthase
VVKVAKQFFKFETGPKLDVVVEDGRVFVKKALAKGEHYDLVMLDAFEDDYIPEHLLTKEFLTEVKGILTPDGVLAANTFSSSNLYPYESATYAAVFGDFYNLKLANRIIWTQPGKLTDRLTMRQNADLMAPEFQKRGFTVDWLMDVPSTIRDWPANTRVLTDQYSPSNLLNGK